MRKEMVFEYAKKQDWGCSDYYFICNLLRHFGLKRIFFYLILDFDLNKYCHATILSVQSIAYVHLPVYF